MGGTGHKDYGDYFKRDNEEPRAGFGVRGLVWALDKPWLLPGGHNGERGLVTAFPLPKHPHSSPFLEGPACPRVCGTEEKARTLEPNRWGLNLGGMTWGRHPSPLSCFLIREWEAG